MTSDNHLKWIVRTALALTCFFVIDLIWIEPTILTPFKGYRPLSPLYAFFIPALSLKILIPVLLSGLLIFLILRRDQIPMFRNVYAVVLVLFVFSVGIKATFAWQRHGMDEMGTELLVYENESMLYDVPRINGVREFLNTYNQNMHSFSMQGQHYPPGYALLLNIIASAGGWQDMNAIKDNINVFGWMILLLGSCAVIPVYLIGRELFDENAGIIASAVFLLTPNAVIFGAVSMDIIFCLVALWALWACVRGFMFLTGILLGVATFLSFSGLPLGLFIGLAIFFLPGSTPARFKQKAVMAVYVLSGFLAFIAVMYFFFGFNFPQCLRNAVTYNAQFMNNVARDYHGTTFADLKPYMLWGNLLAFALYSGFGTVGLWLRSAARRQNFALTVLVFVAILALSGIYEMETERIWLFITAFSVIAAAGEISQKKIALLVCVISLAQTVLYETLFYTIW